MCFERVLFRVFTSSTRSSDLSVQPWELYQPCSAYSADSTLVDRWRWNSVCMGIVTQKGTLMDWVELPCDKVLPALLRTSQEMRGFCKVRSENHRTILFMKSFLFSPSDFKVRNVEFLPNILLVKSFFFQLLQIVEIRINFSFILIVSKATKTYVLLSVNCTLSHYEL